MEPKGEMTPLDWVRGRSEQDHPEGRLTHKGWEKRAASNLFLASQLFTVFLERMESFPSFEHSFLSGVCGAPRP